MARVAPREVVSAAPVFVRATPMHTLASAAMVRLEMDLPRSTNWMRATQGVVMILASLEHWISSGVAVQGIITIEQP